MPRFRSLVVTITLQIALFSHVSCLVAHAQGASPPRYDMGQPVFSDLWVDPTNGDDSRSGATRADALRTFDTAWRRIPMGEALTTGYRIRLLPGVYPQESVPLYFESRWGSYDHPVLIQAENGRGTVTLPNLNVYDCRYFYLVGLRIEAHGGDVLHYEKCDHLLVRQSDVVGIGDYTNPTDEVPQEGCKVNQTQYLYLEDSDFSGANDNAVDFVAVQYGHIVGNKIHRAQDWCIYLKGGSAYIQVEGNEIYDGGAGFTAGQGTGFQFMTSPWIHYEAYDLKVVNNVIHDTQGAGLGVQGGYNILMAHNTLYRVGSRSHVLEIGFGSRNCDGVAGDPGREPCDDYRARGGWGSSVEAVDFDHAAHIPNRNVYLYNNLVYNPAPFQSQWQQFFIPGAYSDPYQTTAGAPNPALADDHLVIRGNVIWNGPPDHPLGLGSESGCLPTNPTCNADQLVTDNAINTVEPQLIDPAHGDYRPLDNAAFLSAARYAVPDFPGGDRPVTPSSPAGTLSNVVAADRDGRTRPALSPAGAYLSAGSTVIPGDLNGNGGVDAVDVHLMLLSLVGMWTPSAAELTAGDVRPRPGMAGRPYGDGRIGADDVNWAFRRLLGLETGAP